MLKKYTITPTDTILEALKRIDANKEGFLIVVDNDSNAVQGVITDGDIRRHIIKCGSIDSSTVADAYTSTCKVVRTSEGIESVIELFKDEQIKFLPITDEDNRLTNIITKPRLHAVLLQNLPVDLSYDFMNLDPTIVDYEIYQRPWGYYKTTVMNPHFQSKVITVYPGKRLSLQRHKRREEHWIIAHGTGTVQIDGSVIKCGSGDSFFIPKGAKHRLSNTDDSENLIITEVQIGDYFGEDDIERFEDDYGRTQKIR